jgi:hypothetical protein
VGDGRRTLEELILDDPRAVAMAKSTLTRTRSVWGRSCPKATA